MQSALFSVELILFYLIILNAFVIVGFVMFRKVTTSRLQRNVDRINSAIIEYFKQTGVTVKASTVRLNSKDKEARYTSFVESEPMKRFRLSHIIEMTLREHIARTCDLKLEKIYWRFPIRSDASRINTELDEADTVTKPTPPSDDYINEGLKELPKATVDELSWEKFQEVSTGPDKAAETQN